MKTKEFIEELKALVASNELQSLAEICGFVGEKLSKKEEDVEIEKRTIGEIMSSAAKCFLDGNEKTKAVETFIKDLERIEKLVSIRESVSNCETVCQDVYQNIANSAFATAFLEKYEPMDIPIAEKILMVGQEMASIASSEFNPDANVINIISVTMAAKELGLTDLYNDGIDVLKCMAKYNDSDIETEERK